MIAGNGKDRLNRRAVSAATEGNRSSVLFPALPGWIDPKVGGTVRAARPLRNDGTYPRKAIGEVLVEKGDLGCVLEIVKLFGEVRYTIEFLERAVVVGARRRDLVRSFDR